MILVNKKKKFSSQDLWKIKGKCNGVKRAKTTVDTQHRLCSYEQTDRGKSQIVFLKCLV